MKKKFIIIITTVNLFGNMFSNETPYFCIHTAPINIIIHHTVEAKKHIFIYM